MNASFNGPKGEIPGERSISTEEEEKKKIALARKKKEREQRLNRNS